MQNIEKDIIFTTGEENSPAKVTVFKEVYNTLIKDVPEINPDVPPDVDTHNKICATTCLLDVVDIGGETHQIHINFQTCMALAQVVDKALRVVISSLVKQPDASTVNPEIIVPEVITNG